MRTRTGSENTILSAAVKAVAAAKVEIKDAGGVYQDWFSRLLSATWGASVDQPIAELRLVLRRDSGPLASLSPFRGDSTLNVGGTAIDAARDIRVSPATTAWGVAPAGADYKLLFQGKTGPIEFASSGMEIIARDLGGFLVTRQIKEASEVRDTTGIPLETLIQDILNLWAPGITLYTPVSPGFMVTSQDWGKGSLFEAIRTAAGGIGWDVRYLWDQGTSSFRLTLFEPARTKTVPDWTIAKNRYFKITQLGINPDDIRNYIQVEFLNSATGARDTVFATDAVSVARFNEQWMEIVEADTSPINTTAEAQALADAALADLAWPIAEQEIELPFFWPVEVGDLIRFTANDIHSDDDLDLAVSSYQHRLERGVARTILTVRGKPAGFYRDWIRRSKNERDETNVDLALINFREIGRTDTEITYGWERGPLVDTVWVFDSLVTEPLATDPWPAEDALPTVVLPTENLYTTGMPVVGQVRVLQFEPRDAALKVGQLRRALVHAPPSVVNGVLDAMEIGEFVDLSLQVRATKSAFPVQATVYENSKTGTVLASHMFTVEATITKADYATLGDRPPAINEKRFWYARLVDASGAEYWVSDSINPRQKPTIDEVIQLPGTTPEFVDLYVKVTDPLGRGGTLRAWLFRSSSVSADPTGPAEWTIAVPVTPATIDPLDLWTPLGGGATAAALDEIRNHGGNGKQVYFQFVLANGVESAITPVLLKTWLQIIDDTGQLSSGAIKLASQFAASIVPPEIVAVLPTLPNASYPAGRIVVLTSDSKLYRSTGTTWTAAVPATDMTGQITTTQITDNSISTPKLAAGSVITAKLAAGAVTANELAADSVIAGKIAAGAISTSALFVAGVVDALAIQAGAVIATKIAAGAITASHIAAGTITADRMASLTGGGLTIDFSASGASAVLSHAAFSLLANGNATFAGTVTATQFTGLSANFTSGMITLAAVPSSYVWANNSNSLVLQADINVTIVAGIGSGVQVGSGSNNLGFYGASPVGKPTVTGTRSGGSALTNLLTALASMGILADSTT